jgi:DNA polymerase V
MTRPLAEASDDTRQITGAALRALETIYRPGYAYGKAGVQLLLLAGKTERQPTLFDDPAAQEKSARLMTVLDAVNREFGRGALRVAAAGTAETARRWQAKAEHRSPRYTTEWSELPQVR